MDRTQDLRASNPRHDVRMDGVYFFRAVLDGPFRKALDSGNYSYCVMVRRGEVRLTIDFPVVTEIALSEGDCVAISGLTTNVFANGRPLQRDDTARFEQLPMASKRSGGTELIVGVAPSEALALGSLMLGPIVIAAKQHPDLARRMWNVAAMLEDEYANNAWIDRDLVVRRLAEIMAVNMSRRVFAERTATIPSEAVTRQIMAAVRAFLSAPDRDWTLADLARTAGMSRTRFAEEFRLTTGQTPGHVIARMRLTAVARRLSSIPLSVDAAAVEAGYGSSAAFVRAFQREFGVTPARWRRERLQATPVRPVHTSQPVLEAQP